MMENPVESVANGGGAGELDGFREATTDGAQGKRRDVAFGFQKKIGGLAGEFTATIEEEASVFQEFRGESEVFRAIDAPEPELLFIALQEM
jgi:hypothetical protein